MILDVIHCIALFGITIMVTIVNYVCLLQSVVAGERSAKHEFGGRLCRGILILACRKACQDTLQIITHKFVYVMIMIKFHTFTNIKLAVMCCESQYNEKHNVQIWKSCCSFLLLEFVENVFTLWECLLRMSFSDLPFR